MWYSFLGTILTVIFGLIISLISTNVMTKKILKLRPIGSVRKEKSQDATKTIEANFTKDNEAIFIVEKYRSQTQQVQHLNGFDNVAMKMEEVA